MLKCDKYEDLIMRYFDHDLSGQRTEKTGSASRFLLELPPFVIAIKRNSEYSGKYGVAEAGARSGKAGHGTGHVVAGPTGQ